MDEFWIDDMKNLFTNENLMQMHKPLFWLVKQKAKKLNSGQAMADLCEAGK